MDLLEVLIDNFTVRNALILDPNCGSASTCIAAARLNRRYVGIEISVAYAALSRKRLGSEVPR
jgi:site-specific DNA-methyltransferase (adenine-specific)